MPPKTPERTREYRNSMVDSQWRDELSDQSLALYAETIGARLSPDLADWIEQGLLVAGNPKHRASA